MKCEGKKGMRSRLLVAAVVVLLTFVGASIMPLAMALPKIAINVSLQYSSIYQGESDDVYVVFSNVGDAIASQITVSVVSLPSGFSADSLNKNGGTLAPQSSPGNVTFHLKTSSSISPGSYQISVQISANNAAPQSGSVSLQVLQTPIAIKLLTPSISAAPVNSPQIFNVITKVDNDGQTPIGDLTLTLTVDTSAFAILGGPVPPYPFILAAQGSTGILNYSLATLQVQKPGYHNITLVVGFGTADGRTHNIQATTSVFFKNWYDPDKLGCLIATATYGSEVAPEVQLLRNFRDDEIMSTQAGRQFMIVFNAWYYSFSPGIAIHISTHPAERAVLKGVLYPLIGILALSSATFSVLHGEPEIAVLVSGLVASFLIGAFYIGVPLGALRFKVRRLRGRSDGRLEKILALVLLGGVVVFAFAEFVLPVLLMLSSVIIVLSCLSFASVFVSSKIARDPHRT
jgi:hypothetical protein